MEEDTSELVRIWREKKLGESRTTEDKPHNFVKQECSVPEMMNLTTIHPDSLPPNAHQHLEQRSMDQRFDQHSIFGGMGSTEPVWIPSDEIPPAPEKKAPKSSFLDPANWKRLTLNEDEAIIKFNKRATNPRYTNGRFKCHECFSNFAREEKLAKHHSINHSEVTRQIVRPTITSSKAQLVIFEAQLIFKCFNTYSERRQIQQIINHENRSSHSRGVTNLVLYILLEP